MGKAETYLFFRHTLWANVLGGLYIDSSAGLRVNAIRVLTYLVLLFVPFSANVTIGFESRTKLMTLALIYNIILAILFISVKLLNVRLHAMFDNEDLYRKTLQEQRRLEREAQAEAEASGGGGDEADPDMDVEEVVDDRSKSSQEEKGEAPIETDAPSVAATYGSDPADDDVVMYKPPGGVVPMEEVLESFIDSEGEEQFYVITREVQPDAAAVTYNPNSGGGMLSAIQSTMSDWLDGSSSGSSTIVDDDDEVATVRVVSNDSREGGGAADSEQSEDDVVRLRLLCCALPRWLHRHTLEELLDRNHHWRIEVPCAVLLAVACSALAFAVQLSGAYPQSAAPVFALWFVVTGSQFSLLKSPQPDSSSSLRNNAISAYTRGFHLALFTSLLLLVKAGADASSSEAEPVYLYGIPFQVHRILVAAASTIVTMLPYSPLLWVCSLLAQVDTTLITLFEFTNSGMFGGGGSTGLRAAFFSLLFSVLACTIGAGVCAFGLVDTLLDVDGSGKLSPLFSLALALLTAFAFLLSRLPPDPALWTSRAFSCYARCFGACDKSKKDGVARKRESGEHVAVAENDDVGEESESEALSGGTRDEEKGARDKPATTRAATGRRDGACAWHRLRLDLARSVLLVIAVFLAHISGLFWYGGETLVLVLLCILTSMGICVHYVYHQLRHENPFTFLQKPILQAREASISEGSLKPTHRVRVTNFERVYSVALIVERIFIVVPLVLAMATHELPLLAADLGVPLALLFVMVASLKCMRMAFGVPGRLWLCALITLLLFRFDARLVASTRTSLLNFYVSTLIVSRLEEAYLKMQFALLYAATPESIGSSFHLLMYPLSLPHCGLFLAQLIVSTLLSLPLYPVAGSAFFLMSYWRPTKFWERNYRSRRRDINDVRLADADGGAASAANNLNAIFYEHLAAGFRRNLAGDISAGRYGEVVAGDFFIVINDKLTSVLHIIDVGNAHCTFQLRGLEFAGTFCHEQEVMAIYPSGGEPRLYRRNRLLQPCVAPIGRVLCACCTSEPVNALSFKDMLRARSRTWSIVHSSLTLPCYSIALSPLYYLLQDRTSLSYFNKSILRALITLLVRSPHLLEWISSEEIGEKLAWHERDANSCREFVPEARLQPDASGIDVALNAFYRTFLNFVTLSMEERRAMWGDDDGEAPSGEQEAHEASAVDDDDFGDEEGIALKSVERANSGSDDGPRGRKGRRGAKGPAAHRRDDEADEVEAAEEAATEGISPRGRSKRKKRREGSREGRKDGKEKEKKEKTATSVPDADANDAEELIRGASKRSDVDDERVRSRSASRKRRRRKKKEENADDDAMDKAQKNDDVMATSTSAGAAERRDVHDADVSDKVRAIDETDDNVDGGGERLPDLEPVTPRAASATTTETRGDSIQEGVTPLNAPLVASDFESIASNSVDEYVSARSLVSSQAPAEVRFVDAASSGVFVDTNDTAAELAVASDTIAVSEAAMARVTQDESAPSTTYTSTSPPLSTSEAVFNYLVQRASPLARALVDLVQHPSGDSGASTRSDLQPLIDAGASVDTSDKFFKLAHVFTRLPTTDSVKNVNHPLWRLLWSMSVLMRRFLYNSTGNGHFNRAMYQTQLELAFRGDLRVDHPDDFWIFSDLRLLHVCTEAIRLAVQLQLDSVELGPMDDDEVVEELRAHLDENTGVVVCNETNPRWQQAVLNDKPSLLSLRHHKEKNQVHIDSNSLHTLRLTRQTMKYTVVGINRESVRSMWAGQQQELMYFGNTNAERGSIQQADSCLRNLINQSCDDPVGYSIFVSPLNTSYGCVWDDILEGDNTWWRRVLRFLLQ